MYSFFLDGEQLPVTPEKLTVKIKGSNKTLTLVNEGDINFLRAPGLTEISFDAVLPMLGKYHFAQSGRKPDYYLDIFEKLMTGKRPFRFIVSRASPSGEILYDTNMKVSMEDYTITEDAAKGPDVTVAVTLKQYISYATKTVKLIKPKNGKPGVSEEQTRDGPSAPKGKTHTVVKGDCLWAIAQAYMGDGSKYPALYAANKATIDNGNKGTGNPKYTIYPGQVLTIP
ncbi:LysM peptidoglycan-binding domain-containing protein [Anaerotruncus colihominis]|uniref:LysM peptidoglycan-binding domain-containing protein n=1 Tax=Anaerotruncus colihominis TaxID=169435 RepID=UPI0018AB9618|nr:LysM peptidoglycan-binding domain-containing protein [Anaerotruncus colihominis]